MKTRKSFLFLSLGAALAAGSHSSRAAIVFSEGFETPAAGAFITAANTNFDVSGTSSSGLSFTATTDTGNIFGNGTANKFNQTVDTTTAAISIREDNLSAVNLGNLATFSAAYRYTGNNTGFQFRAALINGATSSSNYNAFASGVDLSSFGGFSSSTTYRFDLVANNTGAALTNYYGDEDLATGAYDLFITSLDGTFQARVKNDEAFLNFPSPGDSDADGFDSFSFQTFTTATGIGLAWDDVEIRNEAFVTIPEPSAATLSGSFGLLALLRRRR